MKLMEITSEDFQRLTSEDSVAILSVGAIEEHGRHLPLGADCLQPEHVIEQVAARTDVFVAPPIQYGVCISTRPFPGTISVSFDALRAMVRDVLTDLARNGFKNIVVVSGHAGSDHMAALRMAAREVVDSSDVKISVLSDYDILYASGLLPPDDGHAGLGETSRLLDIRCDLVKPDMKSGSNATPKFAILRDVRKYWGGVTGDPSKATKELGKRLNDIVVEGLMRIIEEMKERDAN